MYYIHRNNLNIMEHAAQCHKERSSELLGQSEMYFGTVCDVRLFKQSVISFFFFFCQYLTLVQHPNKSRLHLCFIPHQKTLTSNRDK